MTSRFLPSDRVILVGARLDGPAGPRTFRFALDTGATLTMVSRSAFDTLGYADSDLREAVDILAAGGTIRVRRTTIVGLSALGRRREAFPVVVTRLDRRARLDGLLGLDFLRDSRLTIDFRRGEIELEV